MNNQELLELINKTWPLGVNTDSDIPKLRLQRDEKIIYGYSLNISRVLDITRISLLCHFRLQLRPKTHHLKDTD